MSESAGLSEEIAETKEGGIAGRYAIALFELSQELDKDQSKSLTEDIARLQTMLAESEDLQNLIRSPIISIEEQNAALGAVMQKAKMNEFVQNFVQLVVRNRRAAVLVDMTRKYAQLMAASRDELVASVSSATELDEATKTALSQKLQEIYGKTIILKTREDSSLLGGLVIKVGSQMIDGSLHHKLERLKTALIEA